MTNLLLLATFPGTRVWQRLEEAHTVGVTVPELERLASWAIACVDVAEETNVRTYAALRGQRP